MATTAESIMALRERTGAGVMESKKALEEANGDLEKAAELLRERGVSKAEKKADRVANQGLIESYIHAGGRIGVLVEINCETDFVARTDPFKTLAHEVALQVAASQPDYVSRRDVPAEVLEQERETYRSQAGDKPADIVAKIVDGKLEKFYQDHVLMDQAYIREPDKSIQQLVTEYIAKTGENIIIRRFVRFELGTA